MILIAEGVEDSASLWPSQTSAKVQLGLPDNFVRLSPAPQSPAYFEGLFHPVMTAI